MYEQVLPNEYMATLRELFSHAQVKTRLIHKKNELHGCYSQPYQQPQLARSVVECYQWTIRIFIRYPKKMNPAGLRPGEVQGHPMR
jgi:hypothetical protein